ncbi:Uncharacterized protein TCAP_07074 [Tolypocladium capitatum]|uniref:Uncharacterized protein n=1 Tax=Tolypocladium capitatum TaxID=45235 RepID=A0A2K3Q5B4_9HYPO|nr:Uncharacterized protein TCAP_07074 [Tolypocladium capitatum]
MTVSCELLPLPRLSASTSLSPPPSYALPNQRAHSMPSMPSDAFLPSGSVDTTLAPASPGGMRADVDLSANGSRPSIDGPRPASPAPSPPPGDNRRPPKPVLSRSLPVGSHRSQSQPPSSAYGARHSRIRAFSPAPVPLASNNLYAPTVDAAAAHDPAQFGGLALSSHSLADFAASPSSWPAFPAPSNPLLPLDFALGPAALNDLLPTSSSGFPTSTTSLHPSPFSAFGPGPVSPPTTVGLGAWSSYASPPPGPGTASGDAASMQALPGSLSAAPQHALFEVIHLLRQQFSFLAQAWMADRERLEPRQQQAEEEVRRIQAAMDSAREQWTSERSMMQQQVEVLKAQVYRLHDENAALKAAAAAAQTSKANGVLSLPPGLDGASRRPHFASPGNPRPSLAAAPAPSQPAPLDPRTQPQNSAPNDFLAPLSTGQGLPAPVIDVQEIDPKLEGIPIKANAVQRCTFVSARGQASPASSARRNGPGRDVAARRRWSQRNLSMDRGRDSRAGRASSRDQTMQVLAAEESRRLTMHAGHTPNHSFSLLPTMTATGADSTECQSRGATPSAETQSVGTEDDDVSNPVDHDDGVGREAEAGPDLHSLHVAAEDVQGHLEPQDDVPLKGPLMIKNIPAQDDVFFAQLDRKLESLSRGQNALPSVLQGALEGSGRAAAGPSCVPAPPQQPVGGDASHDARSVPEEEEAEGDEGKRMELEVPIKFRTTSNFGAPFGSM